MQWWVVVTPGMFWGVTKTWSPPRHGGSGPFLYNIGSFCILWSQFSCREKVPLIIQQIRSPSGEGSCHKLFTVSPSFLLRAFCPFLGYNPSRYKCDLCNINKREPLCSLQSFVYLVLRHDRLCNDSLILTTSFRVINKQLFLIILENSVSAALFLTFKKIQTSQSRFQTHFLYQPSFYNFSSGMNLFP